MQLEEWVDHELSGYPPEATIPDYRGPFQREVRGNFVGPFNATMTAVPVPPAGLPSEFRDGWLFKHEFREPISELERLSAADKTLQVPWPSDVIPYVNRLLEDGEARLYPGMGLLAAWKPVTPHQLGSIVDAVRTRLLGLALEIERFHPDAGVPGVEISDRETVTEMVMNVYGGNVAIGSSSVSQSALSIPTIGDWETLQLALTGAGFTESELLELRDAIQADQDAGEGKPGDRMGSRVQRWLARIAKDGAPAAGKGAAGAAAGFALKAVLGYFGLG